MLSVTRVRFKAIPSAQRVMQACRRKHQFLLFLYTGRASLYKIFRPIPLILRNRNKPSGGGDGHRIYRRNRGVFAGYLRFCRGMRQAGRTQMNTFYVIGAVVATGLLVYLIVALLNAEDL